MSTTNYRLALLFHNHSSITGALEGIFAERERSEGVYVDAFAIIPSLNAAILCSSSHDSRPVNRVFYFLSQKLMMRLIGTSSEGYTIPADQANNLTPIHPLDIAARLTLSAHGSLRFFALHQGDQLIGYCRFAGKRSHKDSSITSDVLLALAGFIAKPVPSHCDMTVIPHLIGRAYGERLDGLTSKRWGATETSTLRQLLAIPQGICEAGLAMFFLRNFHDDSLRCIAACPEASEASLKILHDFIQNDRHMFTLVARCGMSLYCKEFPQDIYSGSHKAFARWRPDDHYESLCRDIPSPRSYIGIPVRVDDNVVAVFQLLSHCGTDPAGLSELYTFMRSVISEFGRTLDKQRTSRACQRLMEQSINPLPLAADQAGERFAGQFFKPLLEQVWPHDEFNVYFVPAATDESNPATIPELREVITARTLLELVSDALHSRNLVLREITDTCLARRGILAIPLFSHEAETHGDIGCIIILGNIATLSSRSVTNVAQYLITIGTVAWSENVARMLGKRILKAERAIRGQYDDLWSTVHDLKASLSDVFKKKNNINTLLTNPDIKNDAIRPLLKRYVDVWFESISHVLTLVRDATDKGRLRGITRVQVSRVVLGALKDALTIVGARCDCKMDGDAVVSTSEYDLKRALTEVFLNSAQALSALNPKGAMIDITITKREHSAKPISILIKDNAFRVGRVADVQNALNDPNKTLCKFVRTRCSRLLDIDIDASGDDQELTIAFHLPRELNPR